MPEYLAPGVYVEEFDSPSRPIPGVCTSVDAVLAQRFIESVEHIAGIPGDWAGLNDSDPGITVIELCAWLADSLVHAESGPSHARRDAALHAFSPLLQPPCGSAHVPLVRPRFFAGRLLDVATLAAEQDYLREKLRRHNRLLHGSGIVTGLGVEVVPDGAGERVIVEPGYAIDACGDDIAVPERASLPLPTGATEAFVSLRRWDRPCNPVPGPNGPEATDFEEASIIAMSARVPTHAVALARLVHEQDAWSIDTGFTAPHTT
ncbi:MAG: hypothetical protein ROZ64_15980 [Burkholderiaceae bacterium]|nr:hypothetical protein [Burkholderiaceae bacterium]